MLVADRQPQLSRRSGLPGPCRDMIPDVSTMEEDAMADFTFDGQKLKNNRTGQKVGEIDRNNVRAWNGARFGEIDRKNIRDAHNKVVAVFDGKVVKDDLGKKLATIQEVQKAVEGDAGIELVALWYFFVRK
jgi:hypothetical protein